MAETLTAPVDLDDPNVGRLTPEAFFAAEWEAKRRHFYFNGTVIPVPGASESHYLIAANLLWLLMGRLRDSPFAVAQNDCGVWVPALDSWSYPDVVVYRMPGTFDGARPPKLLTPAVALEVLSPSTEAYDRGEKFDAYQTIPTLTDYVLVHQDRVRAEHFARQGPNQWLLTVLEGAAASLRLDSLDAGMELREVYLKTDLSAA